MSQEKAQLIAPQGHFTVPGLNVAGVVTASSFSGNCTGTASSLAQGSNLVVGVMTASSFAGDVFGNAAGLSTTTAGLKLGIVTATSFAGNFTGIGSGLTGTPNIVAGLVTASQFVGNTPGLAAGISAGKNLNAGIITATTFHGDGSNLTGAGSTAFIKQDVTAQSGTTTIDLNDGNIINLTHSNNTTIAFSNVSTAEDITIIRNLTDNTITWPAAVKWNGGSTPTLIGANPRSPDAAQVFNLVTYNGGTTWYGWQEVSNDPTYWTGFYVFGNNADGCFGNNNETDTSGNDSLPSMSPIEAFQSADITKYAAINGSQNRIMAINYADKTLWAAGNSEFWGQLGLNTTNTSYSSPTQVPGTNWRSVYVGVRGGIATKTDGTLWMWGHNQQGDLGQGNTTSYSSPVQVGSSTDWAAGPRAISFSSDHTTAIKTDGTMWVWGSNERGQLGQNNLTEYNSPVQIPGTTWSKAEARGRWTIALKTDNTLWSWGYGAFGKLGLNVPGGGPGAQASRSSPVQIPGTTWRSFDRHDAHSNADATFATKTDGTLWAWGYNESAGVLGQNDTTRYSSPRQIPGTTWGAACSVNAFYGAVMTKTDGTLWGVGQTGLKKADNSTTWNKFSSPVQIGSGTDWDTSDGRVIISGNSWISVQSI